MFFILRKRDSVRRRKIFSSDDLIKGPDHKWDDKENHNESVYNKRRKLIHNQYSKDLENLVKKLKDPPGDILKYLKETNTKL